MRILIKYQDGEGSITEREISDLQKENDILISAFCHTRDEWRSFNANRIIHAVAQDTGELINPYHLVPEMRNQQSLDSLTWKYRQAIKSVKFFCLTTRGFGKRERPRVVEFVEALLDKSQHSDEDTSKWVNNLWCADLYRYRDGDVSEYLGLLEQIPHSLLDQCRECALKIVVGTGWKPENSDWIQRIDEEFSAHPVVRNPINSGFCP